MLTFYKIDAKHAHHRSPPQYINTSQYIQQRPNTIYRIGCQLLRIANTNIYRDTSVLIPSLTHTGPPPMATYTETDDASCRARGGDRCARPGRVRLGAGSQTRANLVLARIAVRRPLGVSCGVPETRPVGETVRSASDRSKPP